MKEENIRLPPGSNHEAIDELPIYILREGKSDRPCTSVVYETRELKQDETIGTYRSTSSELHLRVRNRSGWTYLWAVRS